MTSSALAAVVIPIKRKINPRGIVPVPPLKAEKNISKKEWEESEQKRLAARIIEPATVTSVVRLKLSPDKESPQIAELMEPHRDPTRYTTVMAGRPLVADITMSNGLKWQANMGLVSHIRWNQPGFLDEICMRVGTPTSYSEDDIVAKIFGDLAHKNKKCDILEPEYTLFLRPYYADGQVRNYDHWLIQWPKGINIAAKPGESDYRRTIGSQLCPEYSFRYLRTEGGDEFGSVIWPQHMRQLFAHIQSVWDQAQEMKMNGKPIWSRFDYMTVRGKMHATAYGPTYWYGGWADIPGLKYVNPNNPLRPINYHREPEKRIPVYHVPTPIAHQGVIPRLEYVQPKTR